MYMLRLGLLAILAASALNADTAYNLRLLLSDKGYSYTAVSAIVAREYADNISLVDRAPAFVKDSSLLNHQYTQFLCNKKEANRIIWGLLPALTKEVVCNVFNYSLFYEHVASKWRDFAPSRVAKEVAVVWVASRAERAVSDYAPSLAPWIDYVPTGMIEFALLHRGLGYCFGQ